MVQLKAFGNASASGEKHVCHKNCIEVMMSIILFIYAHTVIRAFDRQLTLWLLL